MNAPSRAARPAIVLAALLAAAMYVPVRRAVLADEMSGSAEVSSSAVVFLHDRYVHRSLSVFVGNPETSAITEISGPAATGGSVVRFALSPDGRSVAFLADLKTPGVSELYVAPAGGGSPLRVSGELVSGGDVLDFAWAPNGRLIAFLADAITDETNELFSVAVDGGGYTRISAPMVLNGDVYDFAWSADSSAVAYRSDVRSDEVYDLLFADPSGAGKPVRVPGLPLDTHVHEFRWSPDGTRIAMRATPKGASGSEVFLWRRSPAEAAAAAVALPPGGATLPGIEWSRTGRWVAFRHQKSPGPADLYVADDTGRATRVDCGEGGKTGAVEFRWAPTSDAIACVRDSATEGQFQIFTYSPSAGQRATNALPSLGRRDSVQLTTWAWSPDSTRLSCLVAREERPTTELFTETQRTDLFVCPVGGGQPVNVGGPAEKGSGVFEAYWSPDGTRLAYMSDAESPGMYQLFVSAPDGTMRSRLSGTLVRGGNVEPGFHWTRDSRSILYVADARDDQTFELWRVAIDTGKVQLVSGPRIVGSGVDSFAQR